MSWVSGVFSRLYSWVDDEAAGYDIESTRMDADADDIATGINYCLHKGGQNNPTSNLPMGGYKHTGVGLATARTDYATCGQVQDGKFKYNVTKGSLNAYTLALTPTLTGYVTGQVFYFKADRTSSGPATLNIDGVGAKNIYVNGAISAEGDIAAGRMYSVVYDGAYFHLISAGSGSGASYGGAKICLSSAQGLPHNSVTAVTFRTELYDDTDYYTAQTSVLEAPATGRYRISGALVLRARDVGGMGVDYQLLAKAAISLNGVTLDNTASVVCLSTYGADLQGSLGIPMTLPVMFEGNLTVNDQVGMHAFQCTYLGYDAYIEGNGTESGSTWLAIERIK